MVTADRFNGFPAPLGAVPFVFATQEAATAFREAVHSELPRYAVSPIRVDGPRFMVDVTLR